MAFNLVIEFLIELPSEGVFGPLITFKWCTDRNIHPKSVSTSNWTFGIKPTNQTK